MAKVSDFGLSISLKNESKLQQSTSIFSSCASLPFINPDNPSKPALPVATATKIRIKWTAPECLNGRAFSVKSDVWSYSIFLFEVFSYGRTPYPKIPTEHIKDYIYKGNRMKAPEDCPNMIYEIMNQCWRMRPDERPSFAILRKKLTNILFIDWDLVSKSNNNGLFDKKTLSKFIIFFVFKIIECTPIKHTSLVH